MAPPEEKEVTAADPPPMLYLLMDGDGHHEMLEAEIIARIWDIIMSNTDTQFIRSTHTMGGNPLTVIEVV